MKSVLVTGIIATSRFQLPIKQLSLEVEEYTGMRVEKLSRVKLAEREIFCIVLYPCQSHMFMLV